MIDRIRGRREFARLSHDGTRIRSSAFWCTWCPDPTSTTTAVGYAIGRGYGPAVRRNRLRRRLRAVLADLDRTSTLPTGALLIGARQGIDHELTFDEVREQMASLIDRLRASNG